MIFRHLQIEIVIMKRLIVIFHVGVDVVGLVRPHLVHPLFAARGSAGYPRSLPCRFRLGLSFYLDYTRYYTRQGTIWLKFRGKIVHREALRASLLVESGDRIGLEVEKALVASCRNGDRGAYAELVKVHAGRVFAICFGMLGNRHDAEDMAQQTLLKGFMQIQGIRDSGHFGAWIARDRAEPVYRRDPAAKTPGRTGGGPGGSRGQTEEWEYGQLEGALAQLSTRLSRAAAAVLLRRPQHEEHRRDAGDDPGGDPGATEPRPQATAQALTDGGSRMTRSSCQHVQEQLLDLAGSSVPREAGALRDHLDSCPACKAYWAALCADDALLRDCIDALQPAVARIEDGVMRQLAQVQPEASVPAPRRLVPARHGAPVRTQLVALAASAKPQDRDGGCGGPRS